MKPFSLRLNKFVENWFEQNKDKFVVYPESKFNFSDAGTTFKEFTDHYKEKGTVPMWFDDNEDNTFGSTVVNAKFRAFHDYMHVVTGNDFSLGGEKKVYEIQQAMLPKDWELERQIMYCEIVKQAEHYSKDGAEPIKNQREFTREYLNKLI
jgi:hypothetical protein